MNVYDRLIGEMDKEISRLDAYLALYEDKGMRLQLKAKQEAYQNVIRLIREDEYEWG